MGRRIHKINSNAQNVIIDDSVAKKVIAKDYDGVKTLISQGISLDNKNTEGHLPLEVALVNADFDAATILIEGGADVSLSNKLGLTFMHIIIRNVEKYIQAGYTQDKILSLVKLVVDKGADLGLQERRGNTPISLVSQLAKANKPLTEVYTRLAKLFLSLDKNVSTTIQIKNNMGKSPMDYLSRSGNLLLREAIYEKLPAVQSQITEALRVKDLEIQKLMSLGKELVK